CDVQSPQLLTIDFATGTTSAQQLPIGAGSPGFGAEGYSLAIDPVTHVAAVATSCTVPNGTGVATFRAELSLIDLSTGRTTRVFQHVLGTEQLFHGDRFLIGGDSATI